VYVYSLLENDKTCVKLKQVLVILFYRMMVYYYYYYYYIIIITTLYLDIIIYNFCNYCLKSLVVSSFSGKTQIEKYNLMPWNWVHGYECTSGWEDNVWMDLQEIEFEGVDWIHLAQTRDQCLVNMAVNVWSPWNVGKFLSGWMAVGFSRRTEFLGINWLVIR
jgi:hypothetical protein